MKSRGFWRPTMSFFPWSKTARMAVLQGEAERQRQRLEREVP